MSNKSNDKGRAYEAVYLTTLYEEISKIRPATIEKNSSYDAVMRAQARISDSEKESYKISAMAGVAVLFDLEPLILDDADGIIELKIQADKKGIEGDVRDVLIIKKMSNWEIGLSLKHNHFAVKHSRLAKNLDFGNKWYGKACSNQYWDEIKPIFEALDVEHQKGKRWNELGNKNDEVYVPLLNAFQDEIIRQNKSYKNLPRLLVQYLLGMFDFYKIISLDKEKITRLQCFNLRGTLNRQGKKRKSSMRLTPSLLPSRIIAFDFKENSKTTLELYLDRGWQFSFRIHNASTYVESSLKFDVNLVGMPCTIITIDAIWKDGDSMN